MRSAVRGRYHWSPGRSAVRLPPLTSLAVIALAGCTAQPPVATKPPADRLAFCRSVIDVVKPGDKTCGPYIEQLRREQARTFTPGVEGRRASEVCQSATKACQQWTELAKKCEVNMRRRDAGDMSRMEPYCDQAESLREQVTGIPLSTAPGAYNF